MKKKRLSPMDDSLTRLKRAGLKITPARRALVELLMNSTKALSAEDISHRLRSMNLVTIYRNLSTLQEALVIARCELGDGVARFQWQAAEPNEDHHHHHLICQICKKVVPLPHLAQEAALESELSEFSKVLSEKLKFFRIRHQLEFFGVCSDCTNSN